MSVFLECINFEGHFKCWLQSGRYFCLCMLLLEVSSISQAQTMRNFLGAPGASLRIMIPC